MKIPFNKEYYTKNELKYIKDVISNKQHSQGDGYYTDLISNLLEKKLKTNKIFMTTSGTHALELAVSLIDLKANDEVIMPSYTFPSTANAVLNFGGIPVFAEIEKKTLNIDPKDLEKKITNKTKAIIPIHYAGIAAEMDKIMKIAQKYNLYVIEDAAQAVNSKYKDKYLGTIGHFGCFSFHSSKNYICGEGGALLINSDDMEVIEKASIIREKGTNRRSFMKGEVDKYTWVAKGSSYLPSEILMAFLYAQLEKIDEIRKKRKIIFSRYKNELSKYLNFDFLSSVANIPTNRVANYNSFYLIFKEHTYRQVVMNELNNNNIDATFHYIPLHLSKMGKMLGYSQGDLPLTESLAENILRLPLYTGMKEKEVNYVIESLKNIFKEL